MKTNIKWEGSKFDIRVRNDEWKVELPLLRLGRQSVAWEFVRGSPPTWPQPIDLSDYYPVQPRIILLVFAFVFACSYLYLLVVSHLVGYVFPLLFFGFNCFFLHFLSVFACLCCCPTEFMGKWTLEPKMIYCWWPPNPAATAGLCGKRLVVRANADRG